MLRSVRSRVVLLTIAVAVVAVFATAWLATRNVESSLRDNVSQGLESDIAILQTLTDYGATHPSWAGVDELVDELARSTGRRIALVDDGRVLTDSDALAGRDESPLPPAPSAVIDPASPSAVLFAPIIIAAGASGAVSPSAVGSVSTIDGGWIVDLDAVSGAALSVRPWFDEALSDALRPALLQ